MLLKSYNQKFKKEWTKCWLQWKNIMISYLFSKTEPVFRALDWRGLGPLKKNPAMSQSSLCSRDSSNSSFKGNYSHVIVHWVQGNIQIFEGCSIQDLSWHWYCGDPKMPSQSPCLGMTYMEARCYMESWSKSLLSISNCIIEMNTLSSWLPGLWGKSQYGMKGKMEAPYATTLQQRQ